MIFYKLIISYRNPFLFGNIIEVNEMHLRCRPTVVLQGVGEGGAGGGGGRLGLGWHQCRNSLWGAVLAQTERNIIKENDMVHWLQPHRYFRFSSFLSWQRQCVLCPYQVTPGLAHLLFWDRIGERSLKLPWGLRGWWLHIMGMTMKT